MLRPLLLLTCLAGWAQLQAQRIDQLTVEKIMRDPKWIGSSPSNAQWSNDGQTLYFNWNPEVNPGDSLYKVAVTGGQPMKVSVGERQQPPTTIKLP